MKQSRCRLLKLLFSQSFPIIKVGHVSPVWIVCWLESDPLFRNLRFWFNRYKMRNRVVFTYFLVSLMTTVLVSMMLTTFLSDIVLEHISENSLLSLQQTASATDILFNQVNTVQSQMLVERDLQNFVFAKTENKVLTYRADLILKKLMSVYPFIHSIELYNAEADVYFNTLRPVFSEQPAMTEQARETYKALAAGPFAITPRQINMTKNVAPQTYKVLSFIYRPETFVLTPAMVILNLDLAYIEKNMIKYSSADDQSQAMIIDSQGIVIAHSDPDRFLQDLSAENYIERYFADSNEGCLTDTVMGRKMLVTYVRSSVDDWYYIGMTDYEGIVGRMLRTRNIILASTLSIFVIAFIIYMLIASRIYNPFRRMLDKLGGVPAASNDMDLLARTVSRSIWYQNNHEKQCQDLYTEELLFGVLHAKLDESMRRSLRGNFESPVYQVVIFSFDDSTRLRQQSPDLILLHQYCLTNIAGEILAPFGRCYSISITDDRVVALCCLPVETDLKTPIRTIAQSCRDLLKATVSAAVGPAVYELPAISQAFTAAEKLLRYRLFEGHESLIDQLAAEPYLNNDAPYPHELESTLVRDIQNAEPGVVYADLETIAALLAETDCESVRYYAIQLAFAILGSADTADTARQTPVELIREIQNHDTLAEIVSVLEQLASKMTRSVREDQQVNSSHRHQAVIQSIKAYVSEQFFDSRLSIETAADVVHLSPEYVRKLFKQVESISFSHYLSRIRLEAACKLLLETENPVQQVGEQVGLSNPTYFFTLFKKAYSMTPAAFRESYRQRRG